MSWWIWIAGGLVLAAAELVVPGYVFLGFAAGAVVTGGLVWAGLLGGGLPVEIAVFALLSVAAWLAFRRFIGLRPGQVKRIDRDINEG
jgi:membrane protein implicated in regulation of membrane protease activity